MRLTDLGTPATAASHKGLARKDEEVKLAIDDNRYLGKWRAMQIPGYYTFARC